MRSRNPNLLDPVWVIIAGAMDNLEQCSLSREIIADPRSILGDKLAGFSDERIASTIERIKRLPSKDWFPTLRRPESRNMSPSDTLLG